MTNATWLGEMETGTMPEGPGIRRASILDVPAMVRALPLPQTPEGVTATEMSQILRITLTHVAIEHGAAWVVTGEDGDVTESALAIPTWELDGGEELPGLLARETALEPGPGDAPNDVLGWFSALGKAWLITHPVANGSPLAGGLLREVTDWVTPRAAADGVPVVLIAASPPDREAARRLGFAAMDIAGMSGEVWVGVKDLAGAVPTGA